MKTKESSKKDKIYNQISKNEILENDKKLLIKNLGLNNLSHSNLREIKNSYNDNNYTNCKLSNTKYEIKNPLKLSPEIYINTNKNLNNVFKNYTISHEIAENRHKINNLENTNNSLSNKSFAYKKKLLNRNTKSMASLPIRLKLNSKVVNDYSLNKIKNLLYEGRNNNISSYDKTTAQNSIKTNQNLNSNNDLIRIYSKIKPIKKNKTKNKLGSNISNKKSTPNLLISIKKNIKNKEKPCKIFSNSILNNKNKDKIIIDSPNKNKSINKNNKIKKISNTVKKNNNKSKYIFCSLEKILHEIDNKKEKVKKYNNTVESKNYSENTKKESNVDLQKIFNEKIINKLGKENIINGIISNNMKENLKNNKNSRNNNNNNDKNINEQITINLFNNEKNVLNDNNAQNNNYVSTQKISLTHIDTNIKNDLNNIINKDSNNSCINKNYDVNDEEDKKENNFQNEENFSDIDKNNIKNNNSSENQKRSNDNNYDENSSIKTQKNILKKLCDFENMQEMSKQEEEQLIQGEVDNKSAQTQTTVDKNNIISKFIKQPIYDISPRFFINEMPLNSNHILPNKQFMLIKEIEQENQSFPIINVKNILKLNDKSIYNLLSFTYDNYSSIISISKLIKNKINNSLKKIFQHAIDEFSSKYKNFLNVIDYSFIPKEILLNHKKTHIFNLEIKCKIITKETKKSYEIGCNYISNNKAYDYIWKFDLQDKNDIKLWLCTELDIINNSYKKFSYTSQVASFCYNDEIILQFNIFSKGNNIDPKSIEWTDPVESYVAPGVYEKSNFISSISFDQIRACEVETQVLFWKKKLPDDSKGIINDFKKIFEKYFEIKKIYFDESKFYFFKIEMKAKKIGLLKQNKFSSFDLNIIDYKSNIKNEIQCIYLINSNYYTKIMDIRIGTDIILYIIDMKR